MMNNLNHVGHGGQFMAQREMLAGTLLDAPIFDRGEVHAQKVTDPQMATKELTHVNASYSVPATEAQWAGMVQPNLPWAEDHFQERISGIPTNPPPSNEWWPFNRNKNAEHKKADVFSHSYPERFWPRYASESGDVDYSIINRGIRFDLGDLSDLVHVLVNNPRSRQAYLPVWFPEDLQAARAGERVPCTLGYHFMLNVDGQLDCTYLMRSCDFLRFMVDDIYMAGRLQQHVAREANLNEVGTLYISIGSLHVFRGDEFQLRKMTEDDDYDGYLSGVSG